MEYDDEYEAAARSRQENSHRRDDLGMSALVTGDRSYAWRNGSVRSNSST